MTTVCTARGVYARPHPAMQEPLHLAPDAAVPGRPFADPARSDDDLAALAAIRAALVRRHAEGRGAGRWMDAAGAEHWLVAPDWDGAGGARGRRWRSASSGRRATTSTTAPIVDLEHDILARASSLRRPARVLQRALRERAVGQPRPVRRRRAGRGTCGATPCTPTPSRARRATTTRCACIARRWPAGCSGEDGLRLERTSYYDFACDPVWRAVRVAA